jgi:ParB family transcriptional regulator, chromosome partitioning protein
MNSKTPAIRMVPITDITVLNPRVRNKRVFMELVTSIAHLGLKKPITVAERPDSSGYDLVCGQGRLEAFVALGQTNIPAVIVEASEEDCFVMSLVENLARRQHTPLELLHDIGALRERGYSISEIATKTDFSDEYISAICYLLDHGEERLLAGVERGVIPTSIAMEIARANDHDVQQALTEAYESKSLPGNQVMAIRRIIERRSTTGKALGRLGARTQPRGKRPVTAVSLVRAYRKEADRQKLLVKKATIAQSRLIFVVNALRSLFADDHFVTLLRAEGMLTVPRPLATRVGLAQE